MCEDSIVLFSDLDKLCGDNVCYCSTLHRESSMRQEKHGHDGVWYESKILM